MKAIAFPAIGMAIVFSVNVIIKKDKIIDALLGNLRNMC